MPEHFKHLVLDGNGKRKERISLLLLWLRGEGTRSSVCRVKLKWKVLPCSGVLSCAAQGVRTGAPCHGRAALPFQPALSL